MNSSELTSDCCKNSQEPLNFRAGLYPNLPAMGTYHLSTQSLDLILVTALWFFHGGSPWSKVSVFAMKAKSQVNSK